MRENQRLKCWNCLLWSFFFLWLCFILINLPSNGESNAAVHSVVAFNCYLDILESCINCYARRLVSHQLLVLNSWLIVEMWLVKVCFIRITLEYVDLRFFLLIIIICFFDRLQGFLTQFLKSIGTSIPTVSFVLEREFGIFRFQNVFVWLVETSSTKELKGIYIVELFLFSFFNTLFLLYFLLFLWFHNLIIKFMCMLPFFIFQC